MQVPLLNDILIIFGLSAAVLFIGTRLRLPVILGYLLTGVAAGPHGLALVRDINAVKILAEVGVILLLFTIGLEFSFRNLVRIRKSVILGGSLQVLLTVAAASLMSFQFAGSAGEALFIGFLVSLSSTAIVMKILQERAEVETPHGSTALGILIFQDVIILPMMLATPFLAGAPAVVSDSLPVILAKEIGIILAVAAGAKWVVPIVFYRVAQTRNRELFLLSVVVLCLTVAWLTHWAGLSLALGAFLAGLVISESEYGLQALGNILPFRDVFASFFFVSVGMLLHLGSLAQNPAFLALIALCILVFKTFIAVLASLSLGLPLRTAVLVGISISQVGEFSFILSETGTRYGFLSGDLYQMFLASSVLTMAATPFLMTLAPHVADYAVRLPLPRKLKGGVSPAGRTKRVHEKNHLIVVGFGLNGRNLARAAKASGIPYVVIEMNPEAVKEEREKGEPIYFGDAAQEAVLVHANIREARAVVIVINDPAATRRITELARRLNPRTYIIVRTRFLQELAPLMGLGANEVIPEEYETSVEIFSRVLAKYLVPKDEIESFITEVRADGYEMLRTLSREAVSCQDLGVCLPDVDILSFRIGEKSPLIGKTLAETEMRKKYGVTLLAIRREDQTITNPGAETHFQPRDVLFVVGEIKKVAQVEKLIKGPEGESK